MLPPVTGSFTTFATVLQARSRPATKHPDADNTADTKRRRRRRPKIATPSLQDTTEKSRPGGNHAVGWRRDRALARPVRCRFAWARDHVRVEDLLGGGDGHAGDDRRSGRYTPRPTAA
jgi:hypothetical protein